MLLLACTNLAMAVDRESFRFIDHLLSLTGPSAPEVYEDAVVFTASSKARRVGVSFAHEGFATVHWFRKLLKPDAALAAPDPAAAKDAAGKPEYVDTGILFFVYEFPRNLPELEYRLVIDGLWTADPRNPALRLDPVSGLVRSVVPLPDIDEPPATVDALSGSLRFSYRGAPGQRVSVAGTFNAWDPFMYELAEVAPGRYALTLPLPPGTYRYVFYLHGERILDQNNPRKVYTAEGNAVSEASLQ